jgi:hypothetical protein
MYVVESLSDEQLLNINFETRKSCWTVTYNQDGGP